MSYSVSVPAVCSFSGGKDSCLALLRASRLQYDVRTLLVMFDETGLRSRSHGIPLALIERQARALRKELVVRSAGWKTYEAVFIAALRDLRATGHQTAIFGDIDLVEHRAWEQKVCAAADMNALLPLWQTDRRELANEVISAGFRAVVTCVDSRYLPDEFCGRQYDEQFIADLPDGVDACGENGEFHTFVYDGPGFAHPVEYLIDGYDAYRAPIEYGGLRYCFARIRPA